MGPPSLMLVTHMLPWPMARGPLMLSPRLRLMLSTDTMDTPMDTGPTDTAMATPMPAMDTTMARGLLMLSPRPRLRLRLMPLSCMVPMDTPMALVPMAMVPLATLDTPMV